MESCYFPQQVIFTEFKANYGFKCDWHRRKPRDTRHPNKASQNLALVKIELKEFECTLKVESPYGGPNRAPESVHAKASVQDLKLKQPFTKFEVSCSSTDIPEWSRLLVNFSVAVLPFLDMSLSVLYCVQRCRPRWREANTFRNSFSLMYLTFCWSANNENVCKWSKLYLF